MANHEHLAVLRQGAALWNQWRAAHRQAVLDLSEADLSHADLSEADLNQANLSWADLTGAYLMQADLTGAYLVGSKLQGADLSRANLAGANLRGADLRRAHLNNPNLRRANLERVDLGEAVLGWTVLAEVDLSGCQGLETVRHVAPSTIGLDTFLQSQGHIPEAFLRGCGAPDSFLEYAGLLARHPVELHSAFISCSARDEALAQRLYTDFQANGVRCWFASEDRKAGDRFREVIDQAIRLQDRLVLVLSRDSLAAGWVAKEVQAAFRRERQDRRKILFPIRVDDAALAAEDGWAIDLWRTRRVGDFRQWTNPGAYQDAFQRLLHDLRCDEGQPTPSGIPIPAVSKNGGRPQPGRLDETRSPLASVAASPRL